MERASVTELEFDISDADVFLVEASRDAGCTLRLEEVLQRPDETAIEFLSARGVDAERVLDLARDADGIEQARLLRERDGEALFEFVSSSPVATTLAEEHTRVTGITAEAGDGRLVAEVPARISATDVIDSFLDAHPGAELRAKRTLDRTAPMLTPAQGREAVLADLTDKQLEALRMAHAMGYFRWPRDATAAEVAATLDVAGSTFTQHLRVAERKVFDALFDGEGRS